jgi:hypothetical protein
MNKDIDNICFELPVELKKQFKIKLVQQGKKMTDVLKDFIFEYIQEDK